MEFINILVYFQIKNKVFNPNIDRLNYHEKIVMIEG